MFNKNDLILYRTEGIYKVDDVCVPDFSMAQDRLYYVMHSLTTDTTAYTPVDSAVDMRPITKKQDAIQALSKLATMDFVDLTKKNHKGLKDYYQKAIKDQSFENLLMLYKSIMMKKDHLEAKGKKLCQTDVSYLRKITKLLCEELSISLDTDMMKAPALLEQSLVDSLN